MRILFLSRWFPWPTNNGSKLRIYNLLRGLAEQHEITLLSFADQSDVKPNVPEIQSICRQVRVIPWKPFTAQSLGTRMGFLRVVPRSVVETFSPAMAQSIEQTLSAQHFDLVIASQVDTAGYAPYFQGLTALYEEVEIGGLYEQYTQAPSLRLRLRHGLTWWKHRYYLAGQLRYFRACTVASERERQLIAAIAPTYKAIEVIPNCINLGEYVIDCRAERDTMIFTGPFGYKANYEAMVWFLREVYPIIQATIPHLRLTITGDHAGLPLPLATNVTLTGFVQDVRPLIAQSWISLAPLRTGGGTRLKILEAMALGTPVVATTKGAEGLDVKPGEHLLIGDTPEAFAQAVIRLCREPGLHQHLAQKALITVNEKYDWRATMPRFLRLVEQVVREQ
jgi:polysaccharide biosynthesis protein PslH